MGPIGLLSILLIVIINSTSGYLIDYSSNYTEEWKTIDEDAVINLSLTECDPGQYENSNGTCVNCKDFGSKCRIHEECCLIEYMECDFGTKKCGCIDRYVWSHPTHTCYEGMTVVEIVLTLLFSFLICFVISGIIYCCRKPTKRFFERIRERREGRIIAITDEADHENFTSSDSPATAINEQPLTIADLFAIHQGTDTLPSPVTSYPPPEYAIPPEFYHNDKPPEYNDIPVSPPPNYVQALGFQFPAENNNSTIPDISTNNNTS